METEAQLNLQDSSFKRGLKYSGEELGRTYSTYAMGALEDFTLENHCKKLSSHFIHILAKYLEVICDSTAPVFSS